MKKLTLAPLAIAHPAALSAGASESLVDFAHQAGRAFISGITRSEQKAAGQFMTPPKLAKFMAQRLVKNFHQERVRLLEPSAGGGVLVAATVEALLEKSTPPASIEALLYEQDQRLIPVLEALCRRIAKACAAAGVRFMYVIRGEDFLLSELASRDEPVEGLLTIANPPFFKINKTKDERAHRHSYAVYGQPNAYGLFMAATARLTPANGRWCFIVPRSWMNGQYFKAVRQTMFQHLVLDSLHAFESRTDSFEEDAVLQETVVTWATGGTHQDNETKLLFTRSQGMSDMDQAFARTVLSQAVVSADGQATVTLPSEDSCPLAAWTATLSTYGLKVSTGPVIAFRCKEFISTAQSPDSVPLLWMQHVGQQVVSWPVFKKAEHVRATDANRWALVENTPMVLMRRFSPKEDARRVTSAPYLGTLPGAVIGLENHLNYIHRPGGKMSTAEVRGLSALLASNVVDRYLRAIAGSTQINARELRCLPLPPLSIIEAIGSRVSDSPTLQEIDAAVQAELAPPAAFQKVAA